MDEIFSTITFPDGILFILILVLYICSGAEEIEDLNKRIKKLEDKDKQDV